MKLLLTNDDGYFARGLVDLAVALANGGHQVWVSAPGEEMSCAGHALSLTRPVVVKQIDFRSVAPNLKEGVTVPCYAVYGAPADSVKFATHEVFKDVKFDLVISGINSQMNVGTDSMYSGTFAAASEGAVLGYAAMAVSAEMHHGTDYSFAVEFVVSNLKRFARYARPFVTLNVNIPSAYRDEIKGVAVTEMGLRPYNDFYVKNADGGYEIDGGWIDRACDGKDDDSCLADSGYVTIVPVPVVATDHAIKAEMQKEEWSL